MNKAMNIILDKSSVRKVDENGFLHVEVSNISKECVNPYYGYEVPNFEELGLEPEKVYYCYRMGSELVKAAPTFNGLPLLQGHYIESAANPQKEHRVGSLATNCVFNAPYLQCGLIVTEQEAINKIESGECIELSCAYAYDPILQSGTYEGQAYDIIMTNIRGNHVALVEEGRAGSDVLVADAKRKNINKKPKKGAFMGLKAIRKALFGASVALDEAKENVEDNSAQATAIEKAEQNILEAAEAIQSLEVATPSTGDDDFNVKEAVKYGENVERGREEGKEDKSAMDEDKNKEIEKLLSELSSHVPAEMLAKLKNSLTDLGYSKATGDNDFNVKEAVKYGENEERDKEMREHNKDNEPAMDAATIQKNMQAKFRALHKAAEEVEPLIGKVDPFAFDSAADIYLKACQLQKVEATKQSAKDVCSVLLHSNTARTQAVAQDNAFVSSFAQFSNK